VTRGYEKQTAFYVPAPRLLQGRALTNAAAIRPPDRLLVRLSVRLSVCFVVPCPLFNYGTF